MFLFSWLGTLWLWKKLLEKKEEKILYYNRYKKGTTESKLNKQNEHSLDEHFIYSAYKNSFLGLANSNAERSMSK